MERVSEVEVWDPTDLCLLPQGCPAKRDSSPKVLSVVMPRNTSPPTPKKHWHTHTHSWSTDNAVCQSMSASSSFVNLSVWKDFHFCPLFSQLFSEHLFVCHLTSRSLVWNIAFKKSEWFGIKKRTRINYHTFKMMKTKQQYTLPLMPKLLHLYFCNHIC